MKINQFEKQSKLMKTGRALKMRPMCPLLEIPPTLPGKQTYHYYLTRFWTRCSWECADPLFWCLRPLVTHTAVAPVWPFQVSPP